MWSTPFNPFTWAKSSQRVTTHVASVDVRDQKGDLIQMSGLSPGLTILVPLQNHPTIPNKSGFGKLGGLIRHNISVQYGHSVVKVLVAPQDDNHIIPFVRVSQSSAFLPQSRSFECKHVHGKWLQRGNITCRGKTNITITFIALNPGNYLLDAEFNVKQNNVNKEKGGFGETQEQEQCIQTKEPPSPQIENVTYRFTVTEASCVFWDSSESTWKTTGCKVNRYSLLSCLFLLPDVNWLRLIRSTTRT